MEDREKVRPSEPDDVEAREKFLAACEAAGTLVACLLAVLAVLWLLAQL